MPILNVCNLCKTYQAGEAEVKALDNVSFTVEKGEFVSIIGPSGSGKSTLLHILAGIDRPTSGKVYVDGEDIYAKSEKELAYYRRRKAGLIPSPNNTLHPYRWGGSRRNLKWKKQSRTPAHKSWT